MQLYNTIDDVQVQRHVFFLQQNSDLRVENVLRFLVATLCVRRAQRPAGILNLVGQVGSGRGRIQTTAQKSTKRHPHVFGI